MKIIISIDTEKQKVAYELDTSDDHLTKVISFLESLEEQHNKYSPRSSSLDTYLREKHDWEIRKLISRAGRREREELAQRFGCSETTVRNRLKVLVRE